MKILLVGQADSIFFENYTKAIKAQRPDIYFDVYSTHDNRGKYDLSACDNIFQSNWNNSFYNKLKGIRTIIYPLYLCISIFLFLKKNRLKYDIIHYKWLMAGITLLGLFKKHNFEKSIVSLWGSELETQKILYSKNIYCFSLNRFLNKIKFLTYSTEEELDLLSKFTQLEEKHLFFAIYGSNIYSEIEKLIQYETKQESKHYWEIDSQKITVSIGYSGKKLHQHLEIINALLNNQDFRKISDNFLFILPLTHGGSREYYNEITTLLDKNKINYLLISDKMSDLDVAKLRNATDIMLQLSISDGRSASIIESFLTGTIVISGKWLPYKIFHEKGLYFHEIEKIDSTLALKLLDVYQNLNRELDRCKPNVNLMGFETWEKVIPNWIKAYDCMLRKA